MKKAGSTWWGQRWVEALVRMSQEYSNRLTRGRAYAREGRTHDLVIKAGAVTARVTGSRATPYDVRIALGEPSEAVWAKAIAAMAAKAQFTAELLAGRMPKEIDVAFKEAGASLFPMSELDLLTDCSCPDWANPCKHVAATHYVLGEALDRDPFLLFELRGRTKAQVLSALRSARIEDTRRSAAKGTSSARRGNHTEPYEVYVPRVSLSKLKVADYDKPPEPIPPLHLSFGEPSSNGAVLTQLGTPAGWTSENSPTELFSPLVRAAAEEARRIALTEPESQAYPDQEAPVESNQARKAAPKRTGKQKTGTKAKKRTERPPG